MKCPNCRCIVTNNSLVCLYCGYQFPLGEEKTFAIGDNYIETENADNKNSYYTYQDYKSRVGKENTYFNVNDMTLKYFDYRLLFSAVALIITIIILLELLLFFL